MSEEFKNPRLLAPGPVPISPEVLNSLAQPMIHHRTPAFTEELVQAHQGLKECFQTKQPVFILSSTGSGALEAAIVNTLSSGDGVIAVVGGKFGERWAGMAKAFGLKVTLVETTWGEPVDVDVIKSHLESGNIKALLCQASETSTGTWHPVKELAELTRNTDCLFMVDGISATGAVHMPMDEWGIDVLVSGSQKAFMLPAGLSFISLSEKAWKATESSNLPKFYFDLKEEKKAYDQKQTLFSSSVSLIRALNVSLKRLTGENRQKTIDRTLRMSTETQKAVQALGLKVFSKSPSPTVTAISVPEGIDGAKLREHIEQKYQVTLMGGQNHLKGKIIRIGHMGHITADDLCAGLRALALGLNDFKWADFSQDKLDQVIDEYKKNLSH